MLGKVVHVKGDLLKGADCLQQLHLGARWAVSGGSVRQEAEVGDSVKR